MNDPFRLQRLALAAVAGCGGEGGEGGEAVGRALAAGGARLQAYVVHQKLGAFWLDRLSQAPSADRAFIEALRKQRFGETALYAAQKACLLELDALFAAQGIVYAVIKGGHLRELVYPDPAMRPANDIDILVAPAQREAAARALIGAGFALHPDMENISHEVTLTRGPVAIDLHWDILRPGRTRNPMALAILSRRVRLAGFYGPQDTDALFLMLTHPAFARYVCSPTAALSSVVDFLMWAQRRPIDWDPLAARLDEAGLKTAAWIELAWFTMLAGHLPAPRSFIDAVRPGAARAFYLEQWLRRDLPGRLFATPALIQAGLTLVLHDRLSDAARALRGWASARRSRRGDPLLRLAGAIEAAR